MAESILKRKYINCTGGHSQETGSGQYVRCSVRAVDSTCGGQYVRWSVRAVVSAVVST